MAKLDFESVMAATAEKPAAVAAPVNPHRDAIDMLAARVLPRVLALPYAHNPREPWLGNPLVDKTVLATIEMIFALAEEDKLAASKAFEYHRGAPSPQQPIKGTDSKIFDTTADLHQSLSAEQSTDPQAKEGQS